MVGAIGKSEKLHRAGKCSDRFRRWTHSGPFRRTLNDDHGGYSLKKLMSGELPYHYRTVDGIVSDFALGYHALEALLAMASTLPTVTSFRQSDCGEILAAHFVEQEMGYRRLYSKLTMLTSQNTNAWTRFFLNLNASPFQYHFVEAKCGVLPRPRPKKNRTLWHSQANDRVTRRLY